MLEGYRRRNRAVRYRQTAWAVWTIGICAPLMHGGYDEDAKRREQRTMMRSVENIDESGARDVRAESPKTSDRRADRDTSAPSSYAFTVFFDNGRKGFTNYEAGVERITGYTAEDYKRDAALWPRMIHPSDRALVVIVIVLWLLQMFGIIEGFDTLRLN